MNVEVSCNGNSVKALVDDIKAVKKGGIIRIFCAEGSPLFYNDPQFLEAAKFAKHTQRAIIRVITGPVLLVDENGKNGLLHLKKKGIIDRLYHRPTRCWTAHFRVVETDEGYRLCKEVPHPPLPNEAHIANIHDHSQEELEPLTQVLISLFDSWEESLAEISQEPPLRRTRSDLSAMLRKAEEQNLAFAYLNPEQLTDLDAS